MSISPRAGKPIRNGPSSPIHAIRRFGFALCLVLLVGSASFAQDSDAGEQARTIHGTVLNSVTHAPIARALVQSPDERFATLTDSEGHFEVVLPRSDTENENNNAGGVYVSYGVPRSYRGGRIWLGARKPGFLDDSRGRNEATAMAGSDVTITLIPEAIIKGRVTLSTNDAASGVNLQLYSRQVIEGFPRWMPAEGTRTNSAGEFRFAELRPGAYKLLTREMMDNDPVSRVPNGQQYGFPPVYYPGAADLATAASIEVSAGETAEADVSLIRQPYYAVKIPVASGDAEAGLNVSVQGQRGPGYSLGYNDRTQKIEGLLPNGDYVVQAIRYGANSSIGKVNLKVAGEAAQGPLMTLAPASSIALNVKEEFNDTKWDGRVNWQVGGRSFTLHGPRRYLDARVENVDDVEQPGGGGLRAPRQPGDESLVLDDLLPGRYWLRLSTQRGYVASATMGTTDLLREPFVVGAGSNATIDVTLRDDGAEIDGTITNLADQALTFEASDYGLPKAWVYCVPLPESSGRFEQIGVSPDGKFNHPMMAPGSYRILAFSSEQSNLPYRDPEAMKAYENKGQVVNLAAGQKLSVEVHLDAPNE